MYGTRENILWIKHEI